MSKKKNAPKKHKFKHAESAVNSQETVSPGVVAASSILRSAQAISTRDFSYVGRDIRRIGVLVIALILIELLFYYLLVFTSVGPAVYRFVNV